MFATVTIFKTAYTKCMTKFSINSLSFMIIVLTLLFKRPDPMAREAAKVDDLDWS